MTYTEVSYSGSSCVNPTGLKCLDIRRLEAAADSQSAYMRCDIYHRSMGFLACHSLVRAREARASILPPLLHALCTCSKFLIGSKCSIMTACHDLTQL
ncbi:uncharacterized protein K489DRAFT_220499 [Dissoconium aciculare CBS 342.82]|uniref:Uncharacterized protein n=1 Tax=Dissoconium aciculare CBS 342.82 TaxID=1314786 RepID=A0A6J3M4G7_9PEZI|nr:uncharacterized protein K489DRAFT_220499 [Dissoconium aciculare CBS 342.82]KAF1822921.1 hypothetical protein K489DRAFT_220499 [Dissoconium aciculare CBS 342.82]